ncbi:hypothetical protein [Merismopedia glauca]|uniref:Uncharacterized protein n=1 Tax=Merismopedia glauca CCAP 1448/3 TaxID=1296344 RepID=A0A2T1C082_9CYAN|nr:hypothetical protein [Merismopedia glauca]PSB01679.1 hypothetical protein C7B64_16970 [Merismopedia glauca CCAP 1448/3]
MKRLLIAAVSTLTLTAAVPAFAQEMTAYNVNMHHEQTQITPFNLVYNGYQGYLVEQGIPSNGAFDSAVNAGEIKAIDLVKGAIARGRLPQETLNDTSYLHAVQSQLNSFKSH